MVNTADTRAKEYNRQTANMMHIFKCLHTPPCTLVTSAAKPLVKEGTEVIAQGSLVFNRVLYPYGLEVTLYVYA